MAAIAGRGRGGDGGGADAGRVSIEVLTGLQLVVSQPFLTYKN